MNNSFDTPTYGFCEGTIYGHPPEYMNSFTSLFLTLTGLFGLFASKNTNLFGKIFFSSIAFNGIGSFGYHWTNYFGWRFMDEFSMVIISLSSLVPIISCIIEKISKNIAFISVMQSISILGIVSFVTMTLVGDALDYVVFFRVLFGMFLFFGVVGIISLIYMNSNIDRKIIRYSYIGLLLAVFSSVMWSISEILCNNESFHWIKYIPGHAMWHIGLSFSAYYLAQFVIYLSADSTNYRPEFLNDKWYTKILPVVNYESKGLFFLGNSNKGSYYNIDKY